MRTIEQRRAADALQRVQKLGETKDDAFRGRYRAYIERLGPAIVMNGLGQALATERAAAGSEDPPKKCEERAHLAVYEGLQAWLCRPQGGVYSGESDLLEALVGHDEADYLRAQAEALAWLGWHKKFCRASLPKSEGG